MKDLPIDLIYLFYHSDTCRRETGSEDFTDAAGESRAFNIAHLSRFNSDIFTLTTTAAFSCPKCWFCAGESFTSLCVTHRSRKQDAIVALRADGEVRGWR